MRRCSRRWLPLWSISLPGVFVAAISGGCDRAAPYAKYAPPQDDHVVVRPADRMEDGRILLGTASLTAGITGTGPLNSAEIEQWLDDPRNHEPLRVVLPLGLREVDEPPAIPADNPLTRAKIELGRQLYFDLRISESSFTCSHCHLPSNHFTHFGHNLDPTIPHVRTVPVNFNRILGRRQMWDGAAASLEEQAVLPIVHPHEFASTPKKCVQTLEQIEGYRLQFERIFGRVTIEAVGKAIAAFERCLVTLPSAFDYQQQLRRWETRDHASLTEDDQQTMAWLSEQGDQHPMSLAARQGEALFFSDRVGCVNCHRGVNFTDEAFHNTGVGMDEPDPDLGRFLITKDPSDYGAFKTPTLRNVAYTGPYMHRGQLQTLEEVIAWYARGGFENEGLSPLIRPIDLTEEERHQLVEFLKSLSSELTPVESGRLPAD